MDFDVAGPFELSRHTSKKIITRQSVSDLKADLETWEEGLSEACGCYVFALRAGKGYTPYYVGQACKSSVFHEALNASNRGKYNEALGDSAGTPVLFVLPRRTPKGKFRKPKATGGGLGDLDFLEDWLIAAAIEKNPRLINNKKTRFLRKIHVRGFFNAKRGGSTKASQHLEKALW